jgi:hypothetical protein
MKLGICQNKKENSRPLDLDGNPGNPASAINDYGVTSLTRSPVCLRLKSLIKVLWVRERSDYPVSPDLPLLKE